MRRDRTLLRQLTANHRASPGKREEERERERGRGVVRVVVDEAWNRDGARVLASVTLSSSCAVLGIFSRAPKSCPRNRASSEENGEERVVEKPYETRAPGLNLEQGSYPTLPGSAQGG